ncbi:MAG: hypothetical protein AAF975_09615, partial [Spirochaetota bacterium]
GVIKGWASDGSQWTEGVTYYEWQTIILNRTVWFYDSIGSSVATQANKPGKSGSPWIKYYDYLIGRIWPPGSFLPSWKQVNPATYLGVGTWVEIPAGYFLQSWDGNRDISTATPLTNDMLGATEQLPDVKLTIDRPGSWYTDREYRHNANRNEYQHSATSNGRYSYHLKDGKLGSTNTSAGTVYKDGGKVLPKRLYAHIFFRKT